MPLSTVKKVSTLLVCGILFAGLLVAYLASSLHYPYYLLWDGDFVPVLDTLLIGNGQLPAHVHHPALGVYLILVPLTHLGHALGIMSTTSLGDLHTAINPFPCVAELITQLRLVFPFLVLVLVIGLWLTLETTFRPGMLASLAILLFLGIQEAFFFDASMIRSELVSVLAWSLALLSLALAAATGAPGRKALLLLAGGLLLGLAFMTKVQSMVFVVIAALFYLLLESFHGHAGYVPSKKLSAAFLLLSASVFLGFTVLFFAAWRQPVPCARFQNDWDSYFWAGYYGVEFTRWRGAGLPALCVLLAILVAQGALLYLRRSASLAYRLCLLATLLATGFTAAFLLHFLLYRDPAQGWHYLLTNFKVMFFRDRRHFEPTTLNYNRLDLQAMAWHFRYVLIVHAAVLGLAVLLRLVRVLRAAWTALGLMCALSGLAVINTCFLLRYADNDMIWLQSVFNFLTLAYALFIVRTACRLRAPILACCCTLLAVVFVADAAEVGTIHRRIDANFNFFGWKDTWLMQGIFGGHKEYDQLVKGFYATDGMRDEGLRQARNVSYNRRLANFVLQNQSVPATRLGVVSSGFPLWCDDLGWRITAFSPDLEAALTVDSGSLPRKPFAFYDKDSVRKVHNYPEKFRAPEDADTLVLMNRADTDTYVFVEEDDREAVLRAINDYRFPIGEATGKTIEAAKDGEHRTLHGILILNYAELPLAAVKHPFSVVLVPHQGWASSVAARTAKP